MKIIKSFAEFAEAHDAGEKFEHKYKAVWAAADYITNDSMRFIISKIESGDIRIKQKPKAIDMTPFLENGLDCEFGNSSGKLYSYGTLTAIDEDGSFLDEFDDSHTCCKPRLDHTFVWSEDIELPDGLEVKYGWFEEEGLIWERGEGLQPHAVRTAHVAQITGCKENYCFAGEG